MEPNKEWISYFGEPDIEAAAVCPELEKGGHFQC